jgi:hypothetical protein
MVKSKPKIANISINYKPKHLVRLSLKLHFLKFSFWAHFMENFSRYHFGFTVSYILTVILGFHQTKPSSGWRAAKPSSQVVGLEDFHSHSHATIPTDHPPIQGRGL